MRHWFVKSVPATQSADPILARGVVSTRASVGRIHALPPVFSLSHDEGVGEGWGEGNSIWPRILNAGLINRPSPALSSI